MDVSVTLINDGDGFQGEVPLHFQMTAKSRGMPEREREMRETLHHQNGKLQGDTLGGLQHLS